MFFLNILQMKKSFLQRIACHENLQHLLLNFVIVGVSESMLKVMLKMI